MWFAVLAAPAAWVLQLYVGAYLTDVLCLPGAGSSKGHLYSLTNARFVVGLSVVTGVVALVGLVVSVMALRRCTRAGDPTPERRALWMARAGVIVSVLFFVAIAFMFVASYYFEDCVASL